MSRMATGLGLALLLAVCCGVQADDSTSRLRPFGPEMEGFRKPVRDVKAVVDGFLWIDAEDFADYGGWRLDTQFVHKMGSAYLLAAEFGTPVADATTMVDVPKAGNYRLWVRARDWYPEFSPGQFTVCVGGNQSDVVFGKASNDQWQWQSAGDFRLAAGPVALTLKDLTGYFARCDAMILTTDLDYTPPADVDAVRNERARLTGIQLEPHDAGRFEVIVVGAGAAGSCAAIASARTGARTALIQDRPVLGGSASVELGVGVSGAASQHPNSRESGVIEEAGRIRTHEHFPKWSEPFRLLAEKEEDLMVFVNRRVDAVRMADDGHIAAVEAVDTLTGERYVYRADQFVDCTGDGWVGYFAGAKYRFGRESSEEFGEDLAPSESDRITMSGCLMGNLALSFRAQNMGKPVDYSPPAWAAKLPVNDFGRRIRYVTGGEWWLEHEGTVDDLADPEHARDELIRITFGYWDYLKNHWEGREEARNFDLVWVPYGDARRETRRLIGDYILKQQDAQEGLMFDDRISFGGWPLDVHHPEGIYSGPEGPFDCNGHVPIYSIPYRILYSTNVDNLLFAGRHVSVTHIALGTVRVQGTLATLGQAAGTAAAMCVQKRVMPRQLGRDHIDELQQTLLKQDQYIPGVANHDPNDLALTARVSASSSARYDVFDRAKVRPDDLHPLNMPRGVMFPKGDRETLGTVQLRLRSERSDPVELTLHVRGANEPGDFSSGKDIATATATVPAGRETFVNFNVDAAVDSPFVWVWLPKTEGISWRLMTSGPYQACRAYGGGERRPWTVVKGQYYAFSLDPPLRYPIDCSPKNVTNGIARIVERSPNLWMSDPAESMPQWIELEFPKPVTLNTVYLTFDTDLNVHHPSRPLVPQTVTDYTLSTFDGGQWTTVAEVKENFQRRRVHEFDPVKASKLRLTVEATGGDPSARVFEIRAYNEP